MAAMDEADDWARGLDELVEQIAPRFRRVEPCRRVRAYLQGLLAPVKRKNSRFTPAGAGNIRKIERPRRRETWPATSGDSARATYCFQFVAAANSSSSEPGSCRIKPPKAEAMRRRHRTPSASAYARR